MTSLDPVVLDVLTRSLTLITTYRCTAACEQCCFGCTPQSEGRLSLEAMLQAIEQARRDFPSLQIVVFSGGECFLLKEDLFAAIAAAKAHGLLTRCVSNGSWGRTEQAARRTAKLCAESGLTEINFSTGADHQQYVPFESVLHAAKAAVERGITTLITVESDAADSRCVHTALSHPDVRALLAAWPDRFQIRVNSWMPFTSMEKRRSGGVKPAGPCDQVFSNVVVTPHGQVSACCGLTYEHIPEMILGRFDDAPLRSTYATQLADFMKVWLRVEGPEGIARATLPVEKAESLMAECDHICQLCARVHQDERVREGLPAVWQRHVPRVMQTLGEVVLAQVVSAKAPEIAACHRDGGPKPSVVSMFPATLEESP